MYLSETAANAALAALVGNANTTGSTLYFGLWRTLTQSSLLTTG